ncbi:MAG: hypothetical protein VX791_13345 [Pseudomonadota bacterium]|uniref:hypothetical protein n=1 Tax=Pseudooceanicola nitratireducens TaxID=517719 RepID=UPI002EBD17BF|nr:hypothetical protein [Pseudomonadota bacterium]
MAYVTSVEKDDKRFVKSLHPTQLICTVVVGDNNGKRILQLNSYGSAEREHPAKLSQTLQFDENSARQLYEALSKEFGFGETNG